MSEHLPKVDNLCTNPENHAAHLCELRLAGQKERADELSTNPKFICGNCGATANEIGALCNPGPLDEQ